MGEPAAAELCAALLSGGDPETYRAALLYLGGPAGQRVPDESWKLYWSRVWGGRGLLYVWAPSAASAVVSGLTDSHWRVAEMSLKVSALREIAEAGDPAIRLADHELPRVRANAVRTLGVVGDTEHVEVVVQAQDDPESLVRRAAELALRRLRDRLDLA